jgi:import receptor subunit TOM70
MAPTNQAPLLPNSPGPFPVEIPVEQGTSSLWDRLSNWAAENKGVVYTIAGVTLVVGAGGAIYYMSSDSRQDANSTASTKRKKQRERKRAKKDAEKSTSADEAPSTEAKKASVAPTTEDELPEVDESSVAALSDEVRHFSPGFWEAGDVGTTHM